jgi:lysophospholipase L1-like esterase
MSAVPAASHSATGHWVGTWTAAPQRAQTADLPPPPFTRDGRVFADSTLRQTVRVSAGGLRFRLRLSNAYGETDLAIASTCVALPSGGQAGARSIAAGTSRTVTFGGRTAVVIPAGALVVTDPLPFPLPAGANLTVTVYLAAGQPASAGVTSHPGSRTTSYVVRGNHVDEEHLAGAAAQDHWYFLTGVETWSATATAAVMLGDSLTDGRGSTTNGNDRWPDRLCARLRSSQDTAGVAILNQGMGGNRVLRDGAGPSVLARLDRDVLAVSGVRWLVVFAGVNDIGAADASDVAQKQVAADLIAAYEQIVVRAHAQGITAYGATLTPFGGSEPYDDPQGHREGARQAVNERIRANRLFDAFIDSDLAMRDPLHPRLLRSSFDGGDHLHLNQAGYQALASAVPASLFRRGRYPPAGPGGEGSP